MRFARSADDRIGRIQLQQLGLVLVFFLLVFLVVIFLFVVFVIELVFEFLVIVALVQLERFLELQQFGVADAKPEYAAYTERWRGRAAARIAGVSGDAR